MPGTTIGLQKKYKQPVSENKHMYSKTVALIPLRGGSKSIPNKNIKNIGGKPLCAWVLQAAVNTRNITEVYVSTD